MTESPTCGPGYPFVEGPGRGSQSASTGPALPHVDLSTKDQPPTLQAAAAKTAVAPGKAVQKPEPRSFPAAQALAKQRAATNDPRLSYECPFGRKSVYCRDLEGQETAEKSHPPTRKTDPRGRTDRAGEGMIATSLGGSIEPAAPPIRERSVSATARQPQNEKRSRG